jgi:hypothetical protein
VKEDWKAARRILSSTPGLIEPSRRRRRRAGTYNEEAGGCHFCFGFTFKAIAVSCRIASLRDGIGRCFARHSSMLATYSSDARMRIVRILGSSVGRTICIILFCRICSHITQERFRSGV